MMNRELTMEQMEQVNGGELTVEVNYDLFFEMFSNMYGADTVEALRKEFGDDEALDKLFERQSAPFYKRIYPGMENTQIRDGFQVRV